jgi:UDP-glucose 4-epimerase
MNILITGGAGFIGSHVADQFVERGDSVTIVDHWKRKKIRQISSDAKVVKKPFQHRAALREIQLNTPDVICHLAAQTDVTTSVANPLEDFRANLAHTLELLDAAAKAGVKTFIYANSGGAMYGMADSVPTPESASIRAESPYGISKAAAELYLHFYAQQYDMRTVSLRLANVYGPRQLSSGEGGVVAIFAAKLIRGKEAIIYGDGEATRDYVYVEDVAHAFVLAAEKLVSGSFNIGTGVETTVNELWENLKEIHGDESVHVRHVDARAGELERSCLNASLAAKSLGWVPETTLKDGLRKTYDWYKRHHG